jgi:hypothetical protein
MLIKPHARGVWLSRLASLSCPSFQQLHAHQATRPRCVAQSVDRRFAPIISAAAFPSSHTLEVCGSVGSLSLHASEHSTQIGCRDGLRDLISSQLIHIEHATCTAHVAHCMHQSTQSRIGCRDGLQDSLLSGLIRIEHATCLGRVAHCLHQSVRSQMGCRDRLGDLISGQLIHSEHAACLVHVAHHHHLSIGSDGTQRDGARD